MRKAFTFLALTGLMMAAPMARADAPQDWLAAQQTEFAAWQAAHPGGESGIAALKSKTAAQIAAWRPRPAGPKYAELVAQSARLAPDKRNAAAADFAQARIWFEMGDTASAKEFLELGLALDPANVTANFERAEAYRRDADISADLYQQAGYRANAALFYDRVVTLGPTSAEAAEAHQALKLLPHVEEAGDVDNPPVLWRAAGAPKELWDAPYAPRLTIIPAGEYTMGGKVSENKYEMNISDTDNPRHRVRIAYPLAVGTYDVTRDQWAYFIADSHYDTASPCRAPNGVVAGSWQSPGFSQTGNDPAVCISYVDGQAYVAWLSKKTGHTYRLLSEAEWEYAARAGTSTAFWWGDDIGRGHANCPDCGSAWDEKGTSPVGSFPPNPFGLYDMNGNAWQVIADCWNFTYAGAPADGSPWRQGNCASQMERGSAFDQGPYRLGFRAGRGDAFTQRLNVHAIRVARVL